MSPNEVTFWVIISITITIEVFGGIVCWLCAKEVDQCHK